MLNKNQTNKLPAALKWYQLAWLVMIAFFSAGVFSNIPQAKLWSLFWAFMVFPMLPIYIIELLSNRAASFVFDDGKITINRGVVSKTSKIFPYDKVQNVHVKTGALLGLFGLSRLSIWTASQSQLRGRGNADPDGRLYLKKADANALAEIILNKKQ